MKFRVEVASLANLRYSELMKIAYLILVHNTPNHVQRLIKALSSDSSTFFIHLDKKTNDNRFVGINGHNVNFMRERVPVFWGDFSMVEATLILLKNALHHPTRFDRFVLLSGADYPLWSVDGIKEYFQSNMETEFMSLHEMLDKKHSHQPITRLTNYAIRPRSSKVFNLLRHVIGMIVWKIGWLRRDYRKYLGNLAPYAGGQWWAITRDAADYIQCFIHERPEVVQYFKNTIMPDEMFFQTILGNSSFKTRITGTLTYVDWKEGRPANISEKHFDFFKETASFPVDNYFGPRAMLFARKFTDDSATLVAMLERQRHKQED